MKAYTVVLILAAIVFVECGHTFLGTNILRTLVLHKEIRHPSRIFQKRTEFLNFTLPAVSGYKRSIQGVLAYDLTNTGASANLTAGGIGTNFVNILLKSERARELHYDVYIYAGL